MTDYDFRNCDALDLVSSLADESVDCVITDPPYGTTSLPWDSAPDWGVLVPELLRVSRGAVCIFSQLPVACDVIAAAHDRYRLEWVWEKTRPSGFVDVRRKPLRAHENILIFSNAGGYEYHPQMEEGEFRDLSVHRSGKVSYLRDQSMVRTSTPAGCERYPRDVIKFANENANTIHPTQKPLELIRYLVRTYSSAGGAVLDPYAGSGTAGEACAMEERRFIGSELDEGYYEKALDRMRFAYAQGRLFDWDLMTRAGDRR